MPSARLTRNLQDNLITHPDLQSSFDLAELAAKLDYEIQLHHEHQIDLAACLYILQICSFKSSTLSDEHTDSRTDS